MRDKGALRKITINGEVWHWIAEGRAGSVREVRIYSPTKKMKRVSPETLVGEKISHDDDYFYTSIKPSHIKKYILSL